MDSTALGSLWPVSRLTLGGGGLGQLWGRTTRDEAVATVRAAVDGGIELIDVAPSYGDGEAESVVGDAFSGTVPAQVRIVTKHHVGHDSHAVEAKMRRSLDESCRRMKVDFVDLFILHSQILPKPDPSRATFTIPLSLFREKARPALQKLVDEGRVGAWGITAVQFPDVLEEVVSENPAPRVAQMIANLMDAPGDMSWSSDHVDYRALISTVAGRDIGIMGIRAVQAGALTDGLDRDLPRDHPVVVDFERAGPFRLVAKELGITSAGLAHRYALSMAGVDTVVVGVKNREELADCLAAEEAGPLPPDVVAKIDEAVHGR